MHLCLEDARLHRNADIDDVLWRPSGLVHTKQIHLWPAQQFSADRTKRVVRERSSNCCGAGSTTHADAHALGQRMRAIGGNVQTARVSGVPVGRTITLAYVLSGICAGLASVVITGQLETGSPVQWENKLLDVVGATVIGGTSLYGGRGNVIWTLAGVLLLELIDNSLNLLNMSHFTIMIVKGGVILLAAMLDTVRRRMTSQ